MKDIFGVDRHVYNANMLRMVFVRAQVIMDALKLHVMRAIIISEIKPIQIVSEYYQMNNMTNV